MNQLVFIQNNRALTDSLMIAETFGKEHKNVLRDIENLECSDKFNELNFERISYIDSMKRIKPKYLITQDGFAFLVMGYTGKEAARFKEMYINEFNRMKETLKSNVNFEGLSPILQLLIQQEQKQKQLELTQQKHAEQIEVIKETFLQHDENWRKQMNGMIQGAAYRMGGNYKELRNRSYELLEERGRCKLDIRLRNLVERLEHQGYSNSQLKKISRMDAIEIEPRLKEIYTIIVKELTIGSAV